MSSSTSAYSLDIESAAQPSTAPKPSISRRTILISALVIILVLIAVITAVATTATRHSSHPAPPTTTPTPTPAAATYRTLGRGQATSAWKLDTKRGVGQSSAVVSDSTEAALSASRAQSSDVHEFQWSFPQRNQAWLDAELEAVSDPQSTRYGQWTSFETLMASVGPTTDEKVAVVNWLQSNGVHAAAIQDHGDILQVTSTVGQVESLFSTTLHYHRHSLSGQNGTVSAGDVSVPAELSINQLHGVYNYPHQIMHIGTHRSQGNRQVPYMVEEQQQSQHDMQPQSRFHTMQETNKHCSGSFSYYPLVSPQFLATAYNYSLRNTTTGSSGTSAIVTAFGTQAFYPADLAHQQGNIGFTQPPSAAVYNSAGNNYWLYNYGIGDEADLDIQALYQISPTSNNSFYGTNTAGSQTLLQTLTAIAALPSSFRPQVVSISYGFDASDYSYYHSSDGPATESKLQQLGTLGVTVVVAAGDDGANSATNRGCSTAPNSLGYGTISPITTTTFVPQYPASSAYVLSVGETDFLGSATSANQAFGAFTTGVQYPAECDNCPADQSGIGYLCQATNLGEETVSSGNTNNITGQTSGGGLSSVFAAPSWQSKNVSSYLTTKCAATKNCHLPPVGYYNASNRGYPDVTIFGGQFAITYGLEETILGGTSVAAPIWAGIIARLNEVQLAHKGTTLGFINPLLYSMATARPNTFHDIVTGENFCPQGNTQCAAYVISDGKGSTPCKGWHAATGWDPVTGLGSPNVGNIISFLQSR